MFRHDDGPPQSTLGLRIIPGQVSPELLFAPKDWGSSALLDALLVTVVLLPAGTKYKAAPIKGKLEGSSGGILMMDTVGPTFLDAFGKAQGIAFEARGKRHFQLAFSGAGKAVAALRDCDAALLKAWGIDRPIVGGAAKPPEPVEGNRARWFASELYPENAIKNKASGTVVARLDIAADGRVAHCTVVAGSGHAALDDHTCVVFRKRARFRPARDVGGKPVAMSVAHTVHWIFNR